jgi:hypothetical protein
MFAAFCAGLIIGTIAGILSWIGAAAYLEKPETSEEFRPERSDRASYWKAARIETGLSAPERAVAVSPGLRQAEGGSSEPGDAERFRRPFFGGRSRNSKSKLSPAVAAHFGASESPPKRVWAE